MLFTGETSEIVPPATRRLTSTNPMAVHKYVQHMLQHIALHGITEKVKELMLRSTNGEWDDNDDVRQSETIDHLMVLGRTAAEQKCPPKNSGKYPFGHQTSMRLVEGYFIAGFDCASSPTGTRTSSPSNGLRSLYL